MPKHDDCRVRQKLANELREQREVIILHEDDRIGLLGFLRNGLGEALVDDFVLLPVDLAEHGANIGDMT